MTKTAAHTAPLTVDVVILVCPCGMLGLEDAMHTNSQDAWTAAAKHVALNPTRCRPSMHRDSVPAALAPAAR